IHNGSIIYFTVITCNIIDYRKKDHILWVMSARIGWGGLSAGDFLAGALLVFGPFGHPLVIFVLFLVITLFGPLFDHCLSFPYFGQSLLAALQLLWQRFGFSLLGVRLLCSGQQLSHFLA